MFLKLKQRHLLSPILYSLKNVTRQKHALILRTWWKTQRQFPYEWESRSWSWGSFETRVAQSCNYVETIIIEMLRFMMFSCTGFPRFKSCNDKPNMLKVISQQMAYQDSYFEQFIPPVVVLNVCFSRYMCCLPDCLTVPKLHLSNDSHVGMRSAILRVRIIAGENDCMESPKPASRYWWKTDSKAIFFQDSRWFTLTHFTINYDVHLCLKAGQ